VARGLAKHGGEFFCGEGGENRARRDKLSHRGEGDSLDALGAERESRFGCEFEGLLAVFAPGAGTGIAGLEKPAGRGFAEKRFEPTGHIGRVGGRGEFVSHGFDMFVLLSALDDHVHERRFGRAENPGNANHQMAGIDGEDTVFALKLRIAIPTGGLRGIGFGKRTINRAVENVIGAEMDEACSAAAGSLRHDFRRQGIHCQRFIAGGFTGIDIRRARAVDEKIEFSGFEFGSKAVEIRNIGFGASPRNDVVIFRPFLGQRGGKASAPAEDENGFSCGRHHFEVYRRHCGESQFENRVALACLRLVSASSMMTVLEVLIAATSYLKQRGVESPRLNAEHLLAHSLGKKRRMDLYLEFDRPLGEADREPLRGLVKRRGEGVPLQHLLGTVEFFGREFLSDGRALIPRPETEQLLELVLKLAPAAKSFLDVGTGSGVIALTLALEHSEATVTACDISMRALELATENRARHGLANRVVLVESNLLSGVAGTFDVVVANLPYIPAGEIAGLSKEVQHDPVSALDGGEDGLRLIEVLADGVGEKMPPGGLLALEIGHDQSVLVEAMLRERAFRDVATHKDHQGIGRFVTARVG
jgi:release factor glutamine methyltransferase